MGKLLWPANRWSRKRRREVVCVSSRIKLERKIERDTICLKIFIEIDT